MTQKDMIIYDMKFGTNLSGIRNQIRKIKIKRLWEYKNY